MTTTTSDTKGIFKVSQLLSVDNLDAKDLFLVSDYEGNEVRTRKLDYGRLSADIKKQLALKELAHKDLNNIVDNKTIKNVAGKLSCVVSTPSPVTISALSDINNNEISGYEKKTELSLDLSSYASKYSQEQNSNVLSDFLYKGELDFENPSYEELYNAFVSVVTALGGRFRSKYPDIEPVIVKIDGVFDPGTKVYDFVKVNDEEQSLIIATNNGLYKLTKTALTKFKLDDEDRDIRSIAYDGNNTLIAAVYATSNQHETIADRPKDFRCAKIATSLDIGKNFAVSLAYPGLSSLPYKFIIGAPSYGSRSVNFNRESDAQGNWSGPNSIKYINNRFILSYLGGRNSLTDSSVATPTYTSLVKMNDGWKILYGNYNIDEEYVEGIFNLNGKNFVSLYLRKINQQKLYEITGIKSNSNLQYKNGGDTYSFDGAEYEFNEIPSATLSVDNKLQNMVFNEEEQKYYIAYKHGIKSAGLDLEFKDEDLGDIETDLTIKGGNGLYALNGKIFVITKTETSHDSKIYSYNFFVKRDGKFVACDVVDENKLKTSPLPLIDRMWYDKETECYYAASFEGNKDRNFAGLYASTNGFNWKFQNDNIRSNADKYGVGYNDQKLYDLTVE